MPSQRELLGSPVFQDFMIQNAERWLPMEEFLREPSVVFDRGTEDFWTTVTNSPLRDQVFAKIRQGLIVPVNGDMLHDIATVHTSLHVYIAESGKGIPTIPTIINVGGMIAPIGSYQLAHDVPGVYVKKTCYSDGRITSHRAEGVSIVRVNDANLEKHLPRNKWEFLQPFVFPPDRYVRDIRVCTVGGEPASGLVRRARKPLQPENLSGEVLPSIEQYPSARAPGPTEKLTGELRDRVEKEKKDASKLRRERRLYFLSTAERLLAEYGCEPESGNKGLDRITPPVEVVFNGQVVHVQLARYVTYLEWDIEKSIDIFAEIPGLPEPLTLFSVEQNLSTAHATPYLTKTLMLNQFSTIASNDEVLRGVQALDFIAEELTKTQQQVHNK